MKKVYILQIIDRETGKVEEHIRKTNSAFQRLWDKAVENVNPLTDKMIAKEEEV